MNIPDLFAKYDLDNTLLVGYYGGGNYGDELLLEVLLAMFLKRDVTQASIAYRNPSTYAVFHRDAGYHLVDTADKRAFLKALVSHKNIVVGGGGMWGLDVNANILLFSVALFISRWVFGRRVFLLGVGYYNSTGWLGRLSAFFAGKAANHILARDFETFVNFAKISSKTQQDQDIAGYIASEVNEHEYKDQVKQLEQQVHIHGKTIFITLRRFQDKYKNRFTQAVSTILQQNSDKYIVLALLEPKQVDPEGFALLESWQRQYRNVQILDFSFNPLALFFFFRKHHKQLVYMGPQFHAIISAHLNNVPFLPIVYDNKVSQLLKAIGQDRQLSIYQLNSGHLQSFINEFAEEKT